MTPVNAFVLMAKHDNGTKEYKFEKSAPLSYPIPRVGDRVRISSSDVEKFDLPCNTLTITERFQDLQSPIPQIIAHFVLYAEFDQKPQE